MRDNTGKLDPGASLHAVSISSRLPRTAGSMASPRGVNMVQRSQRWHSNSGKNKKNNSNSVATATTTTTTKNNSENNGSNSNRNIQLGQNISGNGHEDTAAPPQGEDNSTLPNSAWTCQNDPSNGNGNDKHERAAVGDISASTQLNIKRRRARSFTSTTVFVRSRQWGMRRPNRTESFRRAATEDDMLSVHQLAVSGGKRQPSFVVNKSSTYSRAAWRRSTSTETFQYRRKHGATARNDGRTGDSGKDSRNRLELSFPSTSAAGAGHTQGLVERERAVKTPSATRASLVEPSVSIGPEKPSRDFYSVRRRKVDPPAGSKLRPDSRRWLYHNRPLCWPASANATTRLHKTKGNGLPATVVRHALVAADTENGTSASAASATFPAPTGTRVP